LAKQKKKLKVAHKEGKSGGASKAELAKIQAKADKEILQAKEELKAAQRAAAAAEEKARKAEKVKGGGGGSGRGDGRWVQAKADDTVRLGAR